MDYSNYFRSKFGDANQIKCSIGGLKNPPMPTKKLFYVSILFDIICLFLSLIVRLHFFLMVLTVTGKEQCSNFRI